MKQLHKSFEKNISAIWKGEKYSLKYSKFLLFCMKLTIFMHSSNIFVFFLLIAVTKIISYDRII